MDNGKVVKIGEPKITKNGWKVVDVVLENDIQGRVLIGKEKDNVWFSCGDTIEYTTEKTDFGVNIKVKKPDKTSFKFNKSNDNWFAINNACLLACHGVIGQDNDSIEESAKFLISLSKRLQ